MLGHVGCQGIGRWIVVDDSCRQLHGVLVRDGVAQVHSPYIGDNMKCSGLLCHPGRHGWSPCAVWITHGLTIKLVITGQDGSLGQDYSRGSPSESRPASENDALAATAEPRTIAATA